MGGSSRERTERTKPLRLSPTNDEVGRSYTALAHEVTDVHNRTTHFQSSASTMRRRDEKEPLWREPAQRTIFLLGAALGRCNHIWESACSAQCPQSVEDDSPSALDARPFRRTSQAELVCQDEERLLRDGCELHDHTVISLRVFFDEQAEYEPVWSIDLEVLARVLDILRVRVMHDPECSADPRVDFRADRVPAPSREQKRPRFAGIKPGIKDTLRHCADLTA